MDINKWLKDAEKKINNAAGGKYALNEILSDGYVSKNLKFDSFEDFKKNAPVNLDVENVEKIENEELNTFVKEHSKFDSWQSLLKSASNELMKKVLKDKGFDMK